MRSPSGAPSASSSSVATRWSGGTSPHATSEGPGPATGRPGPLLFVQREPQMTERFRLARVAQSLLFGGAR